MDWLEFSLLFLGGLAAGVINTLAGNGSAITLSLLIFFGLPADVANATNRIGALAQTTAAVASLRRSKRTRMMLSESYWFILPSIIGSVIGALVAIKIDESILKTIIGIVMLILLFTLITQPDKWKIGTDTYKERKTPLNWILIFLIAVYGGFIQMGIGIMLLSILVLVAHYSLRDANIIKLILSVIFVAPAFFVFFFSGHMRWMPGLALAGGQTLGAVLGARYVLYMPKANVYVKWVLILILSISSVVLLQIPQRIMEWL